MFLAYLTCGEQLLGKQCLFSSIFFRSLQMTNISYKSPFLFYCAKLLLDFVRIPWVLVRCFFPYSIAFHPITVP